jgi:hypothetical protein
MYICILVMPRRYVTDVVHLSSKVQVSITFTKHNTTLNQCIHIKKVRECFVFTACVLVCRNVHDNSRGKL